jgi:cholesterol transport system auxiliary component
MMKRHTILAALAVVMLGGCSLQTTGPAVTEYRLKPVTVEKRTAPTACSEQTLKVSVTLAPDLFKSSQIHYADAEFRQYDYLRSRWAESPDRQLRHFVESVIAQSGLFKSVVTYNSQVYSDYYLEPKINNFMQYFNDDGTATVQVDMEFTLMDQESARAVATMHVNRSEPTPTADALGAVKAFNAIMQESLYETIGWLDDTCKQQSLPEKK